MPSVVSFRAALYLRPTSLSSLLVLLMQHGGEPFFGASFAPPVMPSVVSFRAALLIYTQKTFSCCFIPVLGYNYVLWRSY